MSAAVPVLGVLSRSDTASRIMKGKTMKKLLRILLFVLLFLFLSEPIKAKASSVVLTTESLELLHDGIDLLSYSGSIPYGFLPFVFSSEKDFQDVYEDMFSKQDVFTINGTPNIRPLNSDEYSLLENATIYDDEGNIVTLQELYFGEIDNGYFTEKFYCKNDGTIVYQDSAKDNPYIDVKFGGSELSYVDWQNMYDALSDSLDNNAYHYNLNGDTVGNVTFYYACGGTYQGSPSYAASLFIANQYQPGIVVPNPKNNDTIMSWYTNDLSQFNYEVLLGTIPDAFSFKYTQGNYSVGGYHYNYVCQFWNNTSFIYDQNNTFQNWLNGNNLGSSIFGSIGIHYNSSLINEDTISFKKVTSNADTIDLSDSYSLPTLKQYYDDVTRTKAYPNADFIATDPISILNYPTTIVIEDDVADVVIPFPDNSVAEEEDPAIDYPIDDVIDPSLITNNIPIISDLQNRFPFSIPWDIYRLISGLSVTREAPSFDWEIDIPNYDTWEISFDLSDFNSVAELFRTCFLILFIIGLALFSYKHFFGT